MGALHAITSLSYGFVTRGGGVYMGALHTITSPLVWLRHTRRWGLYGRSTRHYISSRMAPSHEEERAVEAL